MNLPIPRDVMKVGVVPMEQDLEVTRINGDISISGGIEGKFLNLLSRYVGFKYKLVIPPDGEWGVQTDNGTWTGIIGMVSKGITDLGIGYLVMTEGRYRATNFSTPYSIADKTFVTNAPKRLPLTSTFIRPFSLEVWIGCLILLMVFPSILSRLTSKNLPYVDALIQIFGTYCKQPFDLQENSIRMRFVFGCWSVFVTVMTISYCGVLPSFLTVPLQEKSINDIHNLYEAVEKGNIKCLAPRGSSELDVLFRSNNLDLKRIGESIKSNNWFYDLTDGTLVDHLKENTALIGLRLWFSSPDFSEKFLSTESFGVWNVGIALKAGFCCTKRLNVIILRILSAGLFDKLVSDEFFETKLSMSSVVKRDPRNVQTLTLPDLHGSFMLLLLGYCVAFLCFILELTFKF